MATIEPNFRLLLRRNTKERWAFLNPILLSGEPGYEKDTGQLKIGNGKDTWNQLSYVGADKEAILQRYGVVNVIKKENLKDDVITKDVNLIYKVSEEKTLYQWNGNEFEELNEVTTEKINNLINIIDGGNTNE